MSGFLLDTNCISELVRIRPEPGVLAWVGRMLVLDNAIADSWGEVAAPARLRIPVVNPWEPA
jgi:hypothetical protein